MYSGCWLTNRRRRSAGKQGTGEQRQEEPGSEEAKARVRAGEVLNLSPLCGGVPPELAWPYLKRVGEVVMAEAAK